MSQHNQQHNQHNIKEFNPYTFYFVNAIDNHENIDAAAINDVANCYDANGNLDYTPDSCDIPHNCFIPAAEDNSGKQIVNPDLDSETLKKCLNYSYYKNKEQALKYLDATNQDVGSEQKYLDMKADYNEELINSMNLTLGSIVLAGFIIKNLFYP